MTATGLLRMVFVAIGRDTQSSAFLRTPGIDELYSGVTKKTPCALAIVARRRSTVSEASGAHARASKTSPQRQR